VMLAQIKTDATKNDARTLMARSTNSTEAPPNHTPFWSCSGVCLGLIAAGQSKPEVA